MVEKGKKSAWTRAGLNQILEALQEYALHICAAVQMRIVTMTHLQPKAFLDEQVDTFIRSLAHTISITKGNLYKGKLSQQIIADIGCGPIERLNITQEALEKNPSVTRANVIGFDKSKTHIPFTPEGGKHCPKKPRGITFTPKLVRAGDIFNPKTQKLGEDFRQRDITSIVITHPNIARNSLIINVDTMQETCEELIIDPPSGLKKHIDPNWQELICAAASAVAHHELQFVHMTFYGVNEMLLALAALRSLESGIFCEDLDKFTPGQQLTVFKAFAQRVANYCHPLSTHALEGFLPSSLYTLTRKDHVEYTETSIFSTLPEFTQSSLQRDTGFILSITQPKKAGDPPMIHFCSELATSKPTTPESKKTK